MPRERRYATDRPQKQAVTRLLNGAAASHASEEGGSPVAAELLAIVYGELRLIASQFFRDQRSDHTLQRTALVHEAYMRLVDQSIEWQNRNQFFVVAAKAMRSIRVDRARGRGRLKRGGDHRRVPLSLADATPTALDEPTVLAIDEAMTKLAQLDERKARLVELRFFGGLTSEQAADALGISRSTASEEWRMARAWLYARLQDGAS